MTGANVDYGKGEGYGVGISAELIRAWYYKKRIEEIQLHISHRYSGFHTAYEENCAECRRLKKEREGGPK